MPRYKYDINEGLILQFKKGSMMDQIQLHKVKAEGFDAGIKLLEMSTRTQMIDDTKKMIKAIKDSDKIKGLTENLDNLGKEITRLTRNIMDLEADKKLHNRAESIKDKNSSEYREIQKKLEERLKKFGIPPEKIEKELKDKKEEKQKKNKESDEKRREYAVKFENQLKEQGVEKMPMWENARQQAEKEYEELFFKGRNNDLISLAAQKHVWDQRGIEMPNDAQLEIIDTLTKEFQPMNYEAAVRNVRMHMDSVARKRESGGKADFDDTAIAVALMAKLESGKWIDDAIKPLRAKFAAEFGIEGKNMLKQMKSRKKHEGGGGGGVSTDTRDFAEVLKSVAGDEVTKLIKDLRDTGDKNLLDKIEKLIESKRDKISRIGTSVLKNAGLDPTADTRNIAKKINNILKDMEESDLEEILKHL